MAGCRQCLQPPQLELAMTLHLVGIPAIYLINLDRARLYTTQATMKGLWLTYGCCKQVYINCLAHVTADY